MDPNGEERWRIEGYLPKDEFRAQLEMGLARVAFMRKQFGDAEQRYARIIENHASSKVVPEALYWRNVCRYNQSHDVGALQSVARELSERYPESEWSVKASVWAA
jgi:TolA-binding protein